MIDIDIWNMDIGADLISDQVGISLGDMGALSHNNSDIFIPFFVISVTFNTDWFAMMSSVRLSSSWMSSVRFTRVIIR